MKRNTSTQNAVALAAMMLCTPAFAQLSKGTTFLASIAGWMQTVGITVITIAVMWAGFQVMFGHKKLTDLGGLFWGAFMVGGAALIAGWLYSGVAS